jgi:hypothetical protein
MPRAQSVDIGKALAVYLQCISGKWHSLGADYRRCEGRLRKVRDRHEGMQNANAADQPEIKDEAGPPLENQVSSLNYCNRYYVVLMDFRWAPFHYFHIKEPADVFTISIHRD